MALPSTVMIDQARVRGLIGNLLESNLAGTNVAYVTTSRLADEPGAVTSSGENTGPTARILAIDHEADNRKPGDSAARERIVITIDVTAPRRTATGADSAYAYGLESSLTVVARALAYQAIDDETATGHIVRLRDATRSPDIDPSDESRARTGVVQVFGQVVRDTDTGTIQNPIADGDPL